MDIIIKQWLGSLESFGGSVVRIPYALIAMAQNQSLVGGLGSHKFWGTAKKKSNGS